MIWRMASWKDNRLFLLNQIRFFFRCPAFWQDFTFAEQVQHRIAADCALLPGTHYRGQFLGRHARHGKVCVQLHDDGLAGHMVRQVFRGILNMAFHPLPTGSILMVATKGLLRSSSA